MAQPSDAEVTLFQLGESALALPVATRLFGPAVSRYLDRAWAIDVSEQRIAWCDLAIQDEAVIVSHAANQAVIGGRYKTRCRNAFMVRAPVEPQRIVDVQTIHQLPPMPSIDIELPALLRRL